MPPDASLTIVATPIGNLKDLSFRAQETLKSVNYVLCEDTRRGRKLKTYVGFDAPLVSFHEHNERTRLPKVLALMKQGKNVCFDLGCRHAGPFGSRLSIDSKDE